MHTRFTDNQKAGIFTALVLALAVVAALVINAAGLDSNPLGWAVVWSITPTLATVIMLLVVTREGYSSEGWKSLGLLRLPRYRRRQAAHLHHASDGAQLL